MAELHQLQLPIIEVPVADLSWMFALPLWQRDGRRFQVTPAAVAADPAAYPYHYRRVMSADLSWPIHCVEHAGRLVVLDGFHRLLQAHIRGHDLINGMILTAADLKGIS